MNQQLINDRDGLSYLRYFFRTHSIHVQYCSNKICECDKGLLEDHGDLTLEEKREMGLVDAEYVKDFELANPGFTLKDGGWIVEIKDGGN